MSLPIVMIVRVPRPGDARGERGRPAGHALCSVTAWPAPGAIDVRIAQAEGRTLEQLRDDRRRRAEAHAERPFQLYVNGRAGPAVARLCAEARSLGGAIVGP